MGSVNKFIQGFKRFHQEEYLPNAERYRQLVKSGQSPKVMMIACCDSRLTISTSIGALAGDLFIIRNVANLVPHFSEGDQHLSNTAALEFAVKQLGVEDIIVMGHSHCGGIEALMRSMENNLPCGITSWISSFDPIRKKVNASHGEKSFEEKCRLCERLAVLQSISNLHEYPWIQSKIQHGKLNLHAWYYDLGEGMLYAINEKNASLKSLFEQ